MQKQVECKAVEAAMPDLLLDPGAAPATARRHLGACTACQAELASLRETMQMLDSWEAPEPSPFWSSRMGALLREEQAQPRRGWAGMVERLRTQLWVTNRSLKPAMGVAALSLALAVGGGTWFSLSPFNLSTPNAAVTPTEASNTVRDLQSLDENAQVFQQLSSLDGPENSGTD